MGTHRFKPAPATPRLLVDGRAVCIDEPRNGEHGLEGYNFESTYRYQRMQDAKGMYYRVYPGTGSDLPDWLPAACPNYYETCTPRVFHRHFKELT